MNSSKPQQPRVLILDIETSPLIVYTWGLFDQTMGLNQVKEDSHIISFAAKWLGAPEDEVVYMDQRDSKDISKNKEMLKVIWQLMDEADAVLTQNGNKFDLKRLNAEFVINEMEPPSSYIKLDTLLMARKSFGFTSNKLEYMTKKLCKKYKKSGHSQFPGFELWRQCMLGNKEAWNEMKEYNILDILALEELYTRLSPWDTGYNPNVFTEEGTSICTCGSSSFKKYGFKYTKTGKFQRYKCKKCGRETKGRLNLLTKSKKSSLKHV